MFRIAKRLVHCTAALWLSALLSAHANAALFIDVVVAGPDVIMTGSGSANTADLTLIASNFAIGPQVIPASGSIAVGSTIFSLMNLYSGGFTPPGAMGSGGQVFASSGTGEKFGFFGGRLYLPTGYTSGSSLAGTSTFANHSLGTLGVEPGTYTWSWGAGANADSLTINVIPEPSTFALLSAGLGVAVLRRNRQTRRR